MKLHPYWKNVNLLTSIRAYVANGGGFVGIGNPSGYKYLGKYFQLSDVLGVEKEVGFTYCKNKFFGNIDKTHWIINDINMDKVHYVKLNETIYPTGATILDCSINENDPTQNTLQGGNVNSAVNEYQKGRAVYLSGLTDSFEAFRLIYKILLWASHKENQYQKALSSNPLIDCFYYENSDSYALLNNSDSKQDTIFYDKNGNKKEVSLGEYEIKWIM